MKQAFTTEKERAVDLLREEIRRAKGVIQTLEHYLDNDKLTCINSMGMFQAAATRIDRICGELGVVLRLEQELIEEEDV